MHGCLVKYHLHQASLMVQWLKNPPAMETQVQSLGKEFPRRRKWQLTPVFLPGKPYDQRSLVGFSPPGCRVTHDRATEHIIFILHIKILTDNNALYYFKYIKCIHLHFQIWANFESPLYSRYSLNYFVYN